MTNMEILKSLIASGQFHHATYRTDIARGLHVYRHDTNGFNGFAYALYFSALDKAECDAAYDLVRGTGVYEGSYR